MSDVELDAIVLAGYDPERPHGLMGTGSAEPHKGLVQVGGRPMIAYVLDALAASGCVRRVAVVGMEPSEGISYPGEIHYLPNRPSLFANALQGVEFWAQQDSNARRHVLLTSADVPLLTGEMVRWFVEACRPFDRDLYWGITEQGVMERVFPAARRTYLRLVEGRFCNGELYLVRIEPALHPDSVVRRAVEQRKNVLRQVAMLGLWPLLKLIFGRLTLDELLHLAERRLGVAAGAIPLPFAESGMDVDKPHQLAQVEAYLQRKAAGAVGPGWHGQREGEAARS
jgi:molybdopterin-guanine dinucleotide biosynthesis protein A